MMGNMRAAMDEVRDHNSRLTEEIMARPTPAIPDDLEDMLAYEPMFGKTLVLRNTALALEVDDWVRANPGSGVPTFHMLRHMRDHPEDYWSGQKLEYVRQMCPDLFARPRRQKIRDGMAALEARE